MLSLEKLKDLLEENNYPYFEDGYLQGKLDLLEDGDYNSLVRELLIIKSGIPEITLGDITIPSPKEYMLILASKYRTNRTGMVVRYDRY